MGIVRFFFYPLSRAYEQARSSAGRMGDAAKAAKQKFEGLSDEGAVKNPRERFAELVELHQWSEDELAQQAVAVRRTKFFAMVSTVLALLLIMFLAVGVPLYLSILMIPAGLFTVALGLVMTMKYTLFQEQLRRRSLVTVKVLLSEADFWRYVFR